MKMNNPENYLGRSQYSYPSYIPEIWVQCIPLYLLNSPLFLPRASPLKMEALLQYLRHLLSFHISLAGTISKLILPKIPRFPFVIPVVEAFLSLFFRFCCNLEQCTIDLDDRTTMHFWAPAHRKFNKPNLLMIHGYGGNSKFQFAYQVPHSMYAFVQV